MAKCTVAVPWWRSALASALVVATLWVFLPWQLQWTPLRDLVARCRVTPGCDADHTWFDALAALSAPPDNPAGAEVARNVIHTLHLVMFAWFACVVAPHRQARGPAHAPLFCWLALVTALLLQPGLHTSTRTQLRPEPPFSDSVRALFPAAYADAPDMLFALDPPTLVGTFLAYALTRAHTSAAAWLIGVVYGAATLLYAISLRGVSTPSLALTFLAACALARPIEAPASTGCDDDAGESGGDDDDTSDNGAGAYEDDDTLLAAGGMFEIGGSVSDDEDTAARTRQLAQRSFADE